jgi:hypothetical protein
MQVATSFIHSSSNTITTLDINITHLIQSVALVVTTSSTRTTVNVQASAIVIAAQL